MELDASVRDLPGEGREPTPDFDTESRQREPIGPQQLNDQVERLRNGRRQDGGAPVGAPGEDAGNADPSDGGAD